MTTRRLIKNVDDLAGGAHQFGHRLRIDGLQINENFLCTLFGHQNIVLIPSLNGILSSVYGREVGTMQGTLVGWAPNSAVGRLIGRTRMTNSASITMITEAVQVFDVVQNIVGNNSAESSGSRWSPGAHTK